MMDPEALRSGLKNVNWISGGSDAGKSTIARRVGRQYGLRVSATDDVMTSTSGGPTSGRGRSWTADEREVA